MKQLATTLGGTPDFIYLKLIINKLRSELQHEGLEKEVLLHIKQGPEALMTAIDEAFPNGHTIEQQLVNQVCESYDAFIDKFDKVLLTDKNL
jgi:hypothetical protein